MGMERTLCFCRSSFDSGALMSFLRTLEGAEKYRLRHLRREDDTVLLNFMSAGQRGGSTWRARSFTEMHEKKSHVSVNYWCMVGVAWGPGPGISST